MQDLVGQVEPGDAGGLAGASQVGARLDHPTERTEYCPRISVLILVLYTLEIIDLMYERSESGNRVAVLL